jgi:signal transduction histidine kinase
MRSPRQYQGSESCAGTAPGRRVADRKSFLLCGSRSSSSPQCVDCLHAATGLETHWAQSLQEAATRLREQTYSAVVIDQFLLETDPAESDQMIEHLGTAFPIYLNFAVTGMERLVREVRSALHRRKREEGAARRAVEDQMRSEMRETLTAMLLSCELAMSVPEVPDHAVEKIRAIDNLARELRVRLETNSLSASSQTP